MMTEKFNALLAELALAGSGNHCYAQAETIAGWLDEVQHCHEVAAMIRLLNLMNQGRYQEAIRLPCVQQWHSLAPFLAFCEWRLGLGSAFDARMQALRSSENPLFMRFAAAMRSPEVS